jgi:hypothetical protein
MNQWSQVEAKLPGGHIDTGAGRFRGVLVKEMGKGQPENRWKLYPSLSSIYRSTGKR